MIESIDQRRCRAREFPMDGIFVGLFAGLVGTAYFMYGKREQKISAILAGLLLSIYPYFLSNLILVTLIGVALAVVPFVVDF